MTNIEDLKNSFSFISRPFKLLIDMNLRIQSQSSSSAIKLVQQVLNIHLRVGLASNILKIVPLMLQKPGSGDPSPSTFP